MVKIKCKKCSRLLVHYAKGLCGYCYQKKSYHKHRKKRLKEKKIWRKENPNYFNEWRTKNPKKWQKIVNNFKKNKPNYLKKQNIKNRTKRRKWVKCFLEKNPQIKKAGYIIRKAIKQGLLVHPSKLKCKKCNRFAQQYHHYKGYENRNLLKVIPLCISCHRFADKKPKII